MDMGTFRGIFTLVFMALFIGLIIWAYSSGRKKDFDEAANLPFADGDAKKDANTVSKHSDNGENQ